MHQTCCLENTVSMELPATCGPYILSTSSSKETPELQGKVVSKIVHLLLLSVSICATGVTYGKWSPVPTH